MGSNIHIVLVAIFLVRRVVLKVFVLEKCTPIFLFIAYFDPTIKLQDL